ncbi:hypothetical protein ACFWY6_06650 [Streptomyces sp. NPDC059037]|uniref:hypothetical protein n=1 Tax=Streptomyces sp. NPDC059037 TaxID=3346710 RepID=UPI0036CB04B6
MGIKDQFEDKAQDLAGKAKGAMGDKRDDAGERASQERDEASERTSQTSDETQRLAQEQQDRFNQDYDA